MLKEYPASMLARETFVETILSGEIDGDGAKICGMIALRWGEGFFRSRIVAGAIEMSQ